MTETQLITAQMYAKHLLAALLEKSLWTGLVEASNHSLLPLLTQEELCLSPQAVPPPTHAILLQNDSKISLHAPKPAVVARKGSLAKEFVWKERRIKSAAYFFFFSTDNKAGICTKTVNRQ